MHEAHKGQRDLKPNTPLRLIHALRAPTDKDRQRSAVLYRGGTDRWLYSTGWRKAKREERQQVTSSRHLMDSQLLIAPADLVVCLSLYWSNSVIFHQCREWDTTHMPYWMHAVTKNTSEKLTFFLILVFFSLSLSPISNYVISITL